jgi:predicted nucleotidyltransferase
MNVNYVPPDVRAYLIAETLKFVLAACKLPGITRIALVGSLITDKKEPKDADLLVSVTDDIDLEPLARLGRRLQGHAQNINRGGEVFLADPNGNYIGRICHWRECAPGIRMRCDALHCGRREYLHDDLKAITLSKSLVATPPLDLWPEVVARIPLPHDIEQNLVVPLKSRKP